MKRVPVYLSVEEMKIIRHSLYRFQHDGMLDENEDDKLFDRVFNILTETIEQNNEEE